ncbi:VWA domain-containing protein [Candidatus Woesearchaeota archaeon]|nr:VWA domain-containing protein [Candidatus Woesearchaeota archaeon]
MVVFDSVATQVEQLSDIDEVEGKLATSKDEALMHSVLQNDKQTIEEGKLVADAFNRGIGSFTPDLFFQQMVKNYSMARQLFGDTLLRLVSGFDPNYIEKNLPIPEFRKQLLFNIRKKIDVLKDKKLLDDQGMISEKGVDLASMVLYVEELDHLIPRGLIGERVVKKRSQYGEHGQARAYRKGDLYKDVSVRKSVRMAVRRGHLSIEVPDLKIQERQSKGTIYVLYGIDASASMKGAKIETCKKAGIALAYQALQHKDKVGLVVFGADVKSFVPPTDDFTQLLRTLTTIRASRETDFTALVEKSIELFPSVEATKHLIILTDAMPTVGEKPEEETLAAVSKAAAAGITLSLVGIQLDTKGTKLAKEMVRIGQGRLYLVSNLSEVDKLVLQDYDAIRS